ncbi:MAG: hypothetical protein RLN60_05785 [Phycisphaerales bacterium]
MRPRRSFSDRCLAIADRTPIAAAVLALLLLAAPLLWNAWSAVLAGPSSHTHLDDRAFEIPENSAKPVDIRPRLVVPAQALTASLYQNLDPVPVQTEPIQANEPVQTVTIQLIAITMNPQSGSDTVPTAFVFDTGRQEYVEVRAGDSIEGGAVIRSIDQSGLVLELNGREVRVELDT